MRVVKDRTRSSEWCAAGGGATASRGRAALRAMAAVVREPEVTVRSRTPQLIGATRPMSGAVMSPRRCYSRATMHSGLGQTRGERELLDANCQFYDLLWSDTPLIEPQRFNTWPLVQSLLPQSARRLEVGPGLRPRLPTDGTQFVDISVPALRQLRERGGHAVLSQVTALPFVDGAFDLVCALDIIEHVEDEDGALRELSRVARAGATLLLSVPLHPSLWTAFDDFVGHRRRYEPARLRTNAAPCSACSRARRVWSTSACGGSRIIVSVHCGGTTAYSCRSHYGSRRSSSSRPA